MLIQVTYTDDRFDYVKDFMLDSLIESGTIARFRRSTGWVDVSSEAIRKMKPQGGYTGEERRSAERGSSYPVQRRGAERGSSYQA
jgi:hypothetical protein